MAEKKRDPYFDNAKFLLMILVVFGHMMQPFIENEQWNHDLYYTIFAFHMPAFIFISGFFAKSFDPQKKAPVATNFQKFIVPYIFFQWLYSLFNRLSGAEEHFTFQLDVPNWSLWFLISSFFWQISLYFFRRIRPTAGITISILISLLVGYTPFIGRELTLQRTAVFLPCFIIGYYLPKGFFDWFKNFKYKKLFAVGFVVIYALVNYLNEVNKYMFFGSKPYDDFLNFPEWGFLVRIVTFMLAIIGMLAFFSLVPTRETSYTKEGKYTLIAYLLHGFFIRGMRAFDLENIHLGFPGFIVLALASILLTTVLASEPVGKVYNKIERYFLGNKNKNKPTYNES
ncbi:MAG: acyltransferase family protein [Tetragenococcus halophilus]|nr:acyltransferase family protein [Tetragenococcus halophilus]